jgi:hypothetical protein
MKLFAHCSGESNISHNGRDIVSEQAGAVKQSFLDWQKGTIQLESKVSWPLQDGITSLQKIDFSWFNTTVEGNPEAQRDSRMGRN